MAEPLHTGIIKSIAGAHIQVKILQEAACSTCSARKLCTTSESKEKIIDVYHHQGHSFKVGDEVHVYGATTMQTSAVMIAFGIPLLFTICWIPLSLWFLHLSDIVTLLLLFIIIGLYFVLLHLFKSRIGQAFTFTIEKISPQ